MKDPLIEYTIHKLIEAHGGSMKEAEFQAKLCLLNHTLLDEGIDIKLPSYWGGDYDKMIEENRTVTCSCTSCKGVVE